MLDGGITTLVPAGQSNQVVQFAALVALLNVGGSQLAHTVLAVAVPGVATREPCWHCCHRVHAAALVPVEKPPTHGSHSRSLVVVGGTTYVPAGQVVVLMGLQAYEYGVCERCDCHCEAVHTSLTMPGGSERRVRVRSAHERMVK